MRAIIAGSLFVLIAMVVFAPTRAFAIVPTLLYSGRALDATGEPVTGSLEVVVRIYDSATDGTLLFEESFLTADAITTSDGYFSILLRNNEAGALALDEIAALYETLYLELTVNGSILEPRQIMAPVPWALASAFGSSGTGGGGGGGHDTLASLSCSDGQVPVYQGGVWACGTVDPGEINEVDPTIGAQSVGGWCTSNGTTIACNNAAPVVTELDPKVGALSNGSWCTSDGSSINCNASPPLTNETDPQVGTLTNGSWCTSDGTTINCTTSPPLTSETDPQVGTLTAGRWCTSDGVSVSCTSLNPDTRCDNTTCGVITVAQVDYSTPRTHTYYIEESEWRLRQTSGAEISCCGGTGAAFIVSGDDFGGGLWASAHLPDDIIVTNITYYFFDTAPNHRLFFDVLVSTGSAYTTLGSSAATNTSTGWGTVSLAGLPATYSGGALAFRALPQDNAGASVSWPIGYSLGIKTVAITYTMASAP